MNKQDFIKLLEVEQDKSCFTSCFKRSYLNSDDFWGWDVPFVDGLQPDINLSEDGIVILTCNKSLYDDDESVVKRYTYDEFIENYYIVGKRGKGFGL